MDAKLIYAKTPIGDEAVRQSTRVVQRNLRMVLVQVDGKLSVEELSTKIGDPRLVENALRELEEGGFIAPVQGGGAERPIKKRKESSERVSALSQFSTFGPRSTLPEAISPDSAASNFSTFGKPILPASGRHSQLQPEPVPKRAKVSEETEAPVTRKRRGSPLRWALLAAVGVLVACVALLLLYPYKGLKPGIELAASRLLNTPVRIAEVSVAFLPKPALLLSNVSIGEGSDASIEQLRILSPLSLLGSGPRVLPKIEASGVVMPADRLLAMPLFQVKPATQATHLALRHVSVEHMAVTARDVALRDLSGEIEFRSDGQMEQATLFAPERSLKILAKPVEQGGIHLDIEGLGWKPLEGAISFEVFQAKGLLQKGRLLLRDIDTTVLGGVLKGNWLLDWSNGLVMAGDATVARLDCRKVSKVFAPALKLEGELGGALNLRSSGRDWEGLWLNVEAVLDAEISRGLLHGVDLGEIVRRGGQAVRGGSTKFDHLKAMVTINPRQVIGRDLKMSAGMVSATGQFVAGRERPVDASLMVTMQTSVSTMRTPVRISGELSDLVASGK
ncbi:MAG: hypothetical protein D3M94_01220 [Rhodocyclales bacterium GT-UBC]|nr:MAG: hypothetical protein D3M94_01220 [Rhodocyclales bacterium GT-UBC]